MSRVFLSYRRSDTQDVAGRLFERLTLHLSRGSVFRDIDSIPAGVDFAEHLQKSLAECSVVLVLIGPTYLTCTDAQGRRRLFDDPDDFVRAEVEAALELALPIIPITVSHAPMPQAGDLPEPLRPLAKMNGLPIRTDPDFNRDVDRLIAQLAPFLGGHVRAELDQRRQRASKIRERLNFLNSQFQIAGGLMTRGDPLIEGAAYVAKELATRLGDELTPPLLRQRLAQDDQLALSCSTVGWWSARLPSRLDDLFSEIHRACADLGGQLEVFRHLVQLFEGIRRDSYSPAIFLSILTVPGEMLLGEEAPDLSPTQTTQALTTALGSYAALYYSTRYKRATDLINSFVHSATALFKALADDDLVTMSQASTIDAEEEQTHTGSMRALLDAMTGKLAPEDLARLRDRVREIEVSVSKEQASDDLERERAKQDRRD